jgi:hypothetical protein
VLSVYWRNVIDAGPAGFVLLFLLGTAALLALVALIVAAVKPRVDGDPARVVAFACGAALGLGLASAVVVTSRAQRVLLGTAMTGEEYGEAWEIGMHVCEAVFLVTGLALLATGALVAGAGAVHAHRYRPPPDARGSLHGFVPVLAGFVLAVTGASLLRRAHAVEGAEIHSISNFEVAEIVELSSPVVAEAQKHVLVVAAVGSAALMILAARGRKPRRAPTKMAERTALGVFGLGLATFLAARPMARDGAATLPVPPSPFLGCPDVVLDVARMPESAGCAKPCGERPFWGHFGPTFYLHGARAELDGARVSGPEELGAALAEWKTDWHDKHGQPTPPLVLAIPPETRAADLAPWLRVIEGSYRATSILFSLPQKAESRATAGPIERLSRCCCASIELGEEGELEGLSGYATWGEIARAAMASPEGLPFGLRTR